jgi:micrococcal nuclease
MDNIITIFNKIKYYAILIFIIVLTVIGFLVEEEILFIDDINNSNTYQVDRVIDGDTIDIKIDGNTKRVRLLGIDAPETKHPQKKVECYGQESVQFLKQLLENQNVIVEFDFSQDMEDRYGRMIAYVWLEDKLVNLLMIEQGFAFEYTYKNEYKYQKEFIDAEAKAKSNQLGLWGDICDY